MHKGDLMRAGMLGAAANFPWEMAHSLLYRGVTSFTWKQHLGCCGLAALVDGVGVAAIFAVGALAFRASRWTRRRSPIRLGWTALFGMTGAVAVEWLALRLGWWGYGPTMPRVPGTDLGISPLVQFVMLPLVVLFWAMPLWWNYQGRRDANADV